MQTSAKLISPTHPTLHFAHPTLESFVWNTLIRSHAQAPPHSPSSPIFLYKRMRFHGVNPDFHTFPFLLHSFHLPPHLQSGRQIHSQLLFFGFAHDRFVQTSLVNMYSSCGGLNFARQVFDDVAYPDLPTWNSIIHAYAKVGLIGIARNLFDKMPLRNVVSWSCMINGYVKCEEYKMALALFREMQMAKTGVEVKPNGFTMSSLLSACARLGALENGRWAHAYIDRCGMEVDIVLGTGLIDMYGKCGSIERAKSVFIGLGEKKDVRAWSAMICGLAMHGHAEECLELFATMTSKPLGSRPNAVTFLGVLCACVHGGLVRQGKENFRRMSEEFGITPLIQHYGCMVDLYGRAGLIEEAWDVIESMPMEPDVLIWGALLSGSRIHGDIKTCEIALSNLIQLDPTNSSAYVLLSNVYAKMGRWREVRHLRDLMEARGIKKVPGCSLVELGGVVYEFFAGDDPHRESKEIYVMLDEIMKRLKMEGYAGNYYAEEVLLDLEEEEGKELALSLHSEKLAIAFCFLKTSAGTPVRIFKNLRICSDCHVVMKMISKVFIREIVLRDCNRFHHFKGGICSCKDYW